MPGRYEVQVAAKNISTKVVRALTGGGINIAEELIIKGYGIFFL